MLTPSEHKLRASIAAYEMHAVHDPAETTKAATAAFLAKFLDEVDPTGELRKSNPAEAERRAQSKRQAYFARTAFASIKARARKRATP